jgi:hypothetical protein
MAQSFLAALILLCAVLAGCGGGGVAPTSPQTTGSIAGATPMQVPTAAPTPAPTANVVTNTAGLTGLSAGVVLEGSSNNDYSFECPAQGLGSFCEVLSEQNSTPVDLYISLQCTSASSPVGCTYPAWGSHGSIGGASSNPGEADLTIECQPLYGGCSASIWYAAVAQGASPPPLPANPELVWVQPAGSPTPVALQTSSGGGSTTVIPSNTPPPDAPAVVPAAVNVSSTTALTSVTITQADYHGDFAVSTQYPLGSGGSTSGCGAQSPCFSGCSFTFFPAGNGGPIYLVAPQASFSFRSNAYWTNGTPSQPALCPIYIYDYSTNFQAKNITTMEVAVSTLKGQ